MDKSLRIRANIGSDTVIKANVSNDIKTLDILSLSIAQASKYKRLSSNYGIVVGRVLGNNAYGVPNAKLSVFVPLTDNNSSIESIYPFYNVRGKDRDGIRYNLFQTQNDDVCHRNIGTFPSKRYVLDNDSVIEVFDKYWKYTTVTNESGDYMLCGIPSGPQILHCDVDLSDIGVLSQTPMDMIYNGYNAARFESATQFKKSTNLDALPQVVSQDSSINVHPYWGDNSNDEVAITRCDINVGYDFKPTCLFMGSIVTDTGENGFYENCVPARNMGDNASLIAMGGRIEMIRKTDIGTIEQYQIDDEFVINDNGVFCYQVPMNLDYMGTDEYGNIVATNDASKGIPTRACVRFRVTLNEAYSNGTTLQRAQYLVPNNPELQENEEYPKVKNVDNFYEFNTTTPDSCFRNLYWNKVYSIKNYVPRVTSVPSNSMTYWANQKNYSALKNPTIKNSVNAIPFNHVRFEVPYELVKSSEMGLLFEDTSIDMDVQTSLKDTIAKQDIVKLDFYNDWLNGCLYFPLWNKRTVGNAYGAQDFCNCKSNKYKKLAICQNGLIPYDTTALGTDMYAGNERFSSELLESGVINEYVDANEDVFNYYSFGSIKGDNKIVVLYATDIILLGSLSDCDIDAVPMIYDQLVPTSCHLPQVWSEVDEDGVGFKSGQLWVERSNSKIADMSEGLFCGINDSFELKTQPKSYVNAERICELGVTFDSNLTVEAISSNDTLTSITLPKDGMITRAEIFDNNIRSLFASLNNEGLNSLMYDEKTGFAKYKFTYLPLTEFDGRLVKYAPYASSFNAYLSYDNKDENYVNYRFGNSKHFYTSEIPFYNNSFYFYFGLHAGKTALDALKKNYASQCIDDNEDAFKVFITSQSPSPCEDSGQIKVTLSNIQLPYSYAVYKGTDNVVVSGDAMSSKELSVTGLSKGAYTIKVTDALGNTLQRRIALSYPSFGLVYQVMQYNQYDVEGGEYYAYLVIDSIEYDNAKHKVSEVIINDPKYPSNCTCTITADGVEYKLAITSDTYDCQQITSGAKEGELYLEFPSTSPTKYNFGLSLIYLCNGEESKLSVDYQIELKPLNTSESFMLNDVPLNVLCQGIAAPHSDAWSNNHSTSSTTYVNELYYTDKNIETSFNWWHIENVMCDHVNKISNLTLEDRWQYIQNICKSAILLDDATVNEFILTSNDEFDASYRTLYPSYNDIYFTTPSNPIDEWYYSENNYILGSKLCGNIVRDNLTVEGLIGNLPTTVYYEAHFEKGSDSTAYSSPILKALEKEEEHVSNASEGPLTIRSNYVVPLDYGGGGSSSSGKSMGSISGSTQVKDLDGQVKVLLSARTASVDCEWSLYCGMEAAASSITEGYLFNPYIGEPLLSQMDSVITSAINGNYMAVADRHFGVVNGHPMNDMPKSSAPFGVDASEKYEGYLTRARGNYKGKFSDDNNGSYEDIYTIYENSDDWEKHYPYLKTMFDDKRLDYEVVAVIPPSVKDPNIPTRNVNGKMVGFLMNGNPLAYMLDSLGNPCIACDKDISLTGNIYQTSFVFDNGKIEAVTNNSVTRFHSAAATTLTGSKYPINPLVAYNDGDEIKVSSTTLSAPSEITDYIEVNYRRMRPDDRHYQLIREYGLPYSTQYTVSVSSFLYDYKMRDGKAFGTKGETVTFTVGEGVNLVFQNEDRESSVPEFSFFKSPKENYFGFADINIPRVEAYDNKGDDSHRSMTKALFFCPVKAPNISRYFNNTEGILSKLSNESASVKDIYQFMTECMGQHLILASDIMPLRYTDEEFDKVIGMYFADSAFDTLTLKANNKAYSVLSPINMTTNPSVNMLFNQGALWDKSVHNPYELSLIYPLCDNDNGRSKVYYDDNGYAERYFKLVNNVWDEAGNFRSTVFTSVTEGDYLNGVIENYRGIWALGCERELFNNTGDKLYKRIKTIEFPITYDLRPITLKYLNLPTPEIGGEAKGYMISTNGGFSHIELFCFQETDTEDIDKQNLSIINALRNGEFEEAYVEYIDISGITQVTVPVTLTEGLDAYYIADGQMKKDKFTRFIDDTLNRTRCVYAYFVENSDLHYYLYEKTEGIKTFSMILKFKNYKYSFKHLKLSNL